MAEDTRAYPRVHRIRACVILLGHLYSSYSSHVKEAGMLIVSYKVVNYGFLYHLGCSEQNVNIFSQQGTGINLKV